MKVALLATLLVAACGGGAANTSARHSPTQAQTSPQASVSPSGQPTPATSPQPVTGAYGVLYDPSFQTNYTVSLVGVDGKIAASAGASIVTRPSCGASAAALVSLPLSASNSRLYMMGSDGAVSYLAPDGKTGRATMLPRSTASSGTMFAVSPDDRRIAVVIADYSATGASTRLYVEDLNGGGNHIDLFSEKGSQTLWPIGWHGTNNLVLAVVPSCTQGGGPFCCGPQELHVVDPATATRRFTIGGPACRIAGPPSPAGTVCEDTYSFTTAREMSWTAGVLSSFAIPGAQTAFISPDGNYVAVVDAASGVTNVRASGSMQLQACGWIDGTHLLAGGDAQQQPRVADVANNTIVPVAAQGDCGGRVPGGL